MATRFRLPSSGSPAVSPAFESYTHDNAVRRPLPTTDASALTDVAQTPDAADHLVAGDTSHFQGTSEPLAAQTIAAQTVKLDLQGFSAHNSNLLKIQLFIKVVSNDGTTTLATLVAKTTAGTTNMTTGVGNKVLSATTTEYILGAGDAGARIVVEISVVGTPTAAGGTQGHNATMRWGSDGASGDLPETSESGTTFNPWLEFADTLTFSGGGDTTAPVLSAQTVDVDPAGMTPKVTTDEANGTRYMVMVPDGDFDALSEVDKVTRVKAGQQSSGAAAIAAANQAVTATGVQAFLPVTTLSPETPYDCWFVHTDAATNNSTAVKADFTTGLIRVSATVIFQMMAHARVEQDCTFQHMNLGPPAPEPGGILDVAARRRRRPHWSP